MTIKSPTTGSRLPSAFQPVRVTKSDANLSCGVVASTWHDADTAGSASARPLDVVIPNVSAGQWIAATIDFGSASTAAAVMIDLFTIVAGAPVSQFGSATTGVQTWMLPASAYGKVGGMRFYQVQAGDIENGAVRLRMRDYNTTTTARTIAASAGYQLVIEGYGPF